MSHAKQTLTRNTALLPEPVEREITLGDEEVSDVSLATFHVLDKENAVDGQRLSRKNPGGGCSCAQGWAAEAGPTECVAIANRTLRRRRRGSGCQ